MSKSRRRERDPFERKRRLSERNKRQQPQPTWA